MHCVQGLVFSMCYVHIHTCTHVYIHTCIHECIHVYMYTYAYMYTYVYFQKLHQRQTHALHYAQDLISSMCSRTYIHVHTCINTNNNGFGGRLMHDVQEFIDSPGDRDIQVCVCVCMYLCMYTYMNRYR
jgi:hypothetical protein